LPTQQQRFEGPDLQLLLEQVRRELGPKATILRAERHRRGRLLGLGGHLVYRLTVSAPMSAAESSLATPSPKEQSPKDQNPREKAARLAKRLAPPVDPFAALAAHAADRFEPSSPTAALATLTDPPAPPAPGPSPQEFAALLEEAAAALAAPPETPLPAPPAPPPPAPPAPPPAVAPRRSPGPGHARPPRPARSAPGRTRLSDPVLDCRLRRAGLADLDAETVIAALASGQTLPEALASLFSHLPPAPTLPGPEELTILVGPRRPGLRAARSLARLLPASPSTCTVVDAHGQLSDRPLGPSTGPSRRPERPRLVLLEAGYTPKERQRAAQALGALTPARAFGVVAATDKPEDVADWAEALRLHGLCLHGLPATSSPAAVLRLGLPVLLADGRPFGAKEWAELLTALIER